MNQPGWLAVSQAAIQAIGCSLRGRILEDEIVSVKPQPSLMRTRALYQRRSIYDFSRRVPLQLLDLLAEPGHERGQRLTSGFEIAVMFDHKGGLAHKDAKSDREQIARVPAGK